MPFMTFRYRCKILAVAATAVALAISLGSAEAQPCGPENEYISIAGSTTVKPLSDAWAQAYVERCPTVEIDVEGGGSKEGAARLCAVPVESTPVDIGDMSRNWLVPEEVLADESGWKFQCQLPGDESRTVLQLQVAIDAVSITMQKGGDAAKCVEAMGGLTTDQLRWMYSSFNETQLSDNGWNGTAALPNSDGNASTHLWSELSVESACLPNEIEIAGPGTESGTHDFFREVILVDYERLKEDFPETRPYFNKSLAEILNFTESNGNAIAYIGYAYYIAEQGNLYAASIRDTNGENYVFPNEMSVSNGTYTPLSRRIFMNLYNEARSLANTVPFIRFALGPDGTAILQEKDGYVALPEQERTDMLERIGGSGMDSGTTSDGPSATYVPPTESSATAIRQGISLSALTLAAAIGVFVV